ncbi:MAG: LiaF transmembrane domain-containing protein, partial [Chloroflexota bacterium]
MGRPDIDRLFLGLLVIAAGVLLLLETTNVTDDAFGTWWPVFVIAVGLWPMVKGGFRPMLGPAIITFVGAWFLVENVTDLEVDAGVVWPVIIIAIGVALAFGWRGRGRTSAAAGRVDSSSGGALRVSALFGGTERRVSSKSFRGGSVSATFGGVELDLRDAAMEGGQATLDVNVMFGGVDITVPREWDVRLE